MSIKKMLILVSALGLLLFSCRPADPLQRLKADVETEFARSPGTFALAFLDLQDSSRQLLINDTLRFHAASTMKTPVMIELFRQVAGNRFRMTDSVPVINAFYSIVDSSVYSMGIGEDSEEELYGRIGRNATLFDLTTAMITYSSNLATNILIGYVGAENVTRTMRQLGAPYIEVLRGVEDQKAYDLGLSNTTTAYDLMRIFEKIGREKAVTPEASRTMITILEGQKFNEIIPAKLPPGVRVAHKTGWITGVSHDSALVMLPDGRRYVLVLLSKDWEDNDLATDIMSNVSRLVYDYFTGT